MRASAVLSVIFALLGAGLALKCYRCAPPDSGIEGLSTCDQQAEVSCSENATGCATAYIDGKGDLKKGIYKDCENGTSGLPSSFNGCKQIDGANFCVCRGSDLCNLSNDIEQPHVGPVGEPSDETVSSIAPDNTKESKNFSAQSNVAAYLGLFLLLLVLM
ncbi:hypothetical protein M3Y98_00737500 [Aphelenchoides besseyi]|nr:hypothetical protein M3Y98_00737500 [Aphelenchoides besseyi]KAI6211430.1 hypothetical protein M3Y96_00433300 [Aphelenchoides besseyi]